jgi:hypothetical protein
LAAQRIVAPAGPAHVCRLAAVRDLARLLLGRIADLSGKIAGLRAGPITAAAITTDLPPMQTFSKGRDFAA